MSDFKNELEQEVEFINDLISRYLPDETGLDKKIREAMNYSVNAGGIPNLQTHSCHQK